MIPSRPLYSIRLPRSQSGSSLVLVLALIAAVLALAALSSGNIKSSELASATSRDLDLAQQSADSALRAAESFAATLGPSDGNSKCSAANGTVGVCNLASYHYRLSSAAYEDLTVNEAVYCPVSAASCSAVTSLLENVNYSIEFNTGNALLSKQPRYIIEIIPAQVTGEEAQNLVYLFRITAKGWGQSANTQKVVQSVYYPPR